MPRRPKPADLPEYVTLAQICEALKISPRTLRKLRAQRPPVFPPPDWDHEPPAASRPRWLRTTIAAYMERQRKRAPGRHAPPDPEPGADARQVDLAFTDAAFDRAAEIARLGHQDAEPALDGAGWDEVAPPPEPQRDAPWDEGCPGSLS